MLQLHHEDILHVVWSSQHGRERRGRVTQPSPWMCLPVVVSVVVCVVLGLLLFLPPSKTPTHALAIRQPREMVVIVDHGPNTNGSSSSSTLDGDYAAGDANTTPSFDFRMDRAEELVVTVDSAGDSSDDLLLLLRTRNATVKESLVFL